MLDLQCFKKYAVCYWAQASVAGALKIQQEHQLKTEDIEKITIGTFHNAIRLAVRRPEDTEKAQYALPYPVAAALHFEGRLDWNEVSGETIRDENVLQLADRIELIEDVECEARFPADRIAKVSIETKDGGILEAGITNAPWQPEAPPSDEELIKKYNLLANDRVSAEKTDEMREVCLGMSQLLSAKVILELLHPRSA
jgi:2-methylcitrate dehydratase PrpD